MYARKLQYRDQDFEETIFFLQHMHLEEKKRYNLKYSIGDEELAIESIVLLYD